MNSRMTVKDLRTALDGVPDDALVLINDNTRAFQACAAMFEPKAYSGGGEDRLFLALGKGYKVTVTRHALPALWLDIRQE